MYTYLIKSITSLAPDVIDKISNRIGLSSIALSVGTTTAQAAEVTSLAVDTSVLWSLSSADIALTISSIGGVLFIIDKVLLIYLRYREAKRSSTSDPANASRAKRTKKKSKKNRR